MKKTSKETLNNFELKPKSKLLCILQKEGYQNEIAFVTSDEDEWFIDVLTRHKKTKKLKEISCIIRKDMESFINFYKKDGFLEKEIKK